METMIMLRVMDIASRQVSDGARAYKALTGHWRARGPMKHIVSFAKGVLIGAIMVLSAWLLLG
jgi:hypothetical protein